MENPFEMLHKQMQQLQQTVDLMATRPASETPKPERPIDIELAAQILLMKVKTVYQHIDQIPHRKRHGRLYFFESELLDYINHKPAQPAATIRQRAPRKAKPAPTAA